MSQDEVVQQGSGRALARGALGGATVLAALFASDFIGLRLDFMGFSDARATSRIVNEYGLDIVRDQLALLGVLIAVGACLGVAGGGISILRARLRARRRRPRPFLWGAATAACAHVLILLRHLVVYPQLYTEALYDRGGWRRAAMLFFTRHAHPWSFPLLGAALFVAACPLREGATALRARASGLLRRRGDAAAPSSEGHRRGRRAAAATLLILAVGWSVAHVLRPRPAPAARPSVLLIAVDSLRADRVFGPDAQRFPVLSALASRSVRFRQAHVTVPRTFPSFVTLLTGRYPHHHGVRHMFPSAAERARIGPSLPATLAQAGWRTAVVSDYAGEIFARTPLGFQTVDAPRFDMHTIVALRGLQIHTHALPYAAGLVERLFPFVQALSERADPTLLADRALDRLHQLAGDAREGHPFFATVFFSTPHFPYAAPFPYYERYADPGYAGPFLYDKPPLSPAAVGPDDARQIQALYDGAVAAVDAQIGRLLAALDADGVADRTIVVLLADHGENLWEDPRAGMGHGDHLIGERTVHVPLLVLDPRVGRPQAATAHDVDGIVRDVDLAPTLAALCGVAPPPTDGVDLAPLLYGQQADLGLPAFSETEYWFVPTGPGFGDDERMPYPAVTGATDLADDGDVYMRPEIEPVVIAAKHRALRLGDWKLTYRPTRAGVSLSLFDLAHDPDERVDVAARYPQQLAAMRARLYGWLLSDPTVVQRGDFVVPR